MGGIGRVAVDGCGGDVVKEEEGEEVCECVRVSATRRQQDRVPMDVWDGDWEEEGVWC